jgi:hypothetical protein
VGVNGDRGVLDCSSTKALATASLALPDLLARAACALDSLTRDDHDFRQNPCSSFQSLYGKVVKISRERKCYSVVADLRLVTGEELGRPSPEQTPAEAGK